jgi:hypothetical protein
MYRRASHTVTPEQSNRFFAELPYDVLAIGKWDLFLAEFLPESLMPV